MFKNLKLRTRLIISFSLTILAVFTVGLVAQIELSNIELRFQGESTERVERITQNVELSNLSQNIRYYDEILRQSARNYVFTNDAGWKNRYYEYSEKLDDTIGDAAKKGNDQNKDYINKIDSANTTLIALEGRAFRLADQGRREQAIQLLNSDDYQTQKDNYMTGLLEYTDYRLGEESETLTKSYNELKEVDDNLVGTVKASSIFLGIFITATAVFVLIVGLLTTFFLSRRIKRLQELTEEISSGRLDIDIDKSLINSRDEMGVLARSFNELAQKLKNYFKQTDEDIRRRTATLEETKKLIEERLAEAERLNDTFVGRELKMRELKAENIKLKSQNKHHEDKS